MSQWKKTVQRAFGAIKIYNDFDHEAEIADFTRRWGDTNLETFLHVLQVGQGTEKVLALFAVGLAATPQVQQIIRPFLESPEMMERWASALCLAEIQDTSALPYLKTMLLEGLASHSWFWELGSEWYDTQRSRLAYLLGNWGLPCLAPALRQALQETCRLEQQFFSQDRSCCYSDVQVWHGYQDALAYALGQIGAFGALCGLPLTTHHHPRLIIHLCLGHLQARTRFRDMFAEMMNNEALKKEVAVVLEQRFGFSLIEQQEGVEQFVVKHFQLMEEFVGEPLSDEFDLNRFPF